MKRYLLFVFYDYYPHGGWLDMLNDFEGLNEAKLRGERWVSESRDPANQPAWHIVDTSIGRIVAKSDAK